MHIRTDTGLGYLIERIWTDDLENTPVLALGYEPFGLTLDEPVAKRICAQGREYTRKDCWAIGEPMPEYRYRPLQLFD